MFRLKFLLPSSGIFSNIKMLIPEAKLFSKHSKKFLKMEAKLLVETFEKIPEDGSKHFSRMP